MLSDERHFMYKLYLKSLFCKVNPLFYDGRVKSSATRATFSHLIERKRGRDEEGNGEGERKNERESERKRKRERERERERESDQIAGLCVRAEDRSGRGRAYSPSYGQSLQRGQRGPTLSSPLLSLSPAHTRTSSAAGRHSHCENIFPSDQESTHDTW